MADEDVIRRLTTIVAADVEGYSRLIAADEEGTLAALRGHRREMIEPKISEYRGRIANTAGDSLLIEFPSVVEALRCTMDIQRVMAERNAQIPVDRRIAFRIGINIGDVVEQDGDLLGDGVNVAARLEGLSEPGGFCLSRAARDQVRDRLDIALEDMGEVQVKNIARPVRVFKFLQQGASRDGGLKPLSKPARRWLAGLALAAMVVMAIIGGGGFWWFGGGQTAPTDPPVAAIHDGKPSIAVLPLDNLSTDKEQEYFADGMSEDIITDLSKISGLVVIARNSSFQFKGQKFDIKDIARKLGVRYVLEGSIRRSGDQVRINVQLIDGANGAHLWAERYDGALEDIFSRFDALLTTAAPSAACIAPSSITEWNITRRVVVSYFLMIFCSASLLVFAVTFSFFSVGSTEPNST